MERQFEIIGEAMNRLLKMEPDLHDDFPEARDIISFRNILIHGYSSVDDRLVFNIAETKLPGLKNKVKNFLK